MDRLRAACAVAVLIVLALALSACAGVDWPSPAGADGTPAHGLRIVVPREEITALERAPLCCGSLATLPFQPFPREGSLTFELDASAPVFAFETGRSRFAAFRLPDWPRPLELELVSRTSALRPDFMPPRTIFNPSVVLLDAQYREVRRLEGPDTFTVHGPEPGRSSIELQGRAWIDEPPERAAYLLVLTTDALRARTADARGLPIVGFSPVGLIDLSLRSAPFVTPPVRFRSAAHAADPGTLPRLALHEDLLVVDARGVQFAERQGRGYVPVASIPFELLIAARWDDGLLARERLRLTWRDGEAVRTRRFGLVREQGQPYDALKPVLAEIEARIRPAWHRESVGIVAEAIEPEIVFRDPPASGAAQRLLDSAMTGGAMTASVCGLCAGGGCTPEVLAPCAGLFAIGAALGTAVGVGRELVTSGGRPEPAPVLPSQVLGQGAPQVRTDAAARLSPAALAGCVRAAGAAQASPVGSDAPSPPSDRPPWWIEQGRSARLVDDAAQADFALRFALARIELVGQAPAAPANAAADWPVRLSAVARVTLARREAGQAAPSIEVRWDGPEAPLGRWSKADDETLHDALDAACQGLAARILAQAASDWRASLPGSGADQGRVRVP